MGCLLRLYRFVDMYDLLCVYGHAKSIRNLNKRKKRSGEGFLISHSVKKRKSL
eukprot:UN13683